MTISLNGNSIPTDGSGHVRVTTIGDNDETALICRSGNTISSGGNWYLHPTEMSTDDGDRIGSGGVPDRGWRTLQKMLGCFKPSVVVSVSMNNAN